MNAGWYPPPDGSQGQWFWDGQQWFVPASVIEYHASRVVAPQLEAMFRAGFITGFNHNIGLEVNA